MKKILTDPLTINFHPALARLSARDLEREIRYLEGQAEIQRGELRDLEEAHAVRPYVPAFMRTMRRGYRSLLRELHRQIAAVRLALCARTSVQT